MDIEGLGMEGSSYYSSSSTSSTSFLFALPSNTTSTDAMRIDGLLDFTNHDCLLEAATDPTAAPAKHRHLLPTSDYMSDFPSAAARTGSHIFSGEKRMDPPSGLHLPTFSDDLYVPSEEAAELEWLSKFVDDSFSDMPFPSPGSTTPSVHLPTDPPTAVPVRVRSSRSRAPATAVCSSSQPQLLHRSSSSSSSSASSRSSSELKESGCGGKKREVEGSGRDRMGTEGLGSRKCTHCSSEKTPQWRTGPLGPKTLCNACGVRYKSGRLVPEYRPAASPTFVLTQHSNSHRKVMELRRQNEQLVGHRHSKSAAASSRSAARKPEMLFHDYEV